MVVILNELKAKIWQIATGASLLISAGLGVALLMEKIETRHLTKSRDRLEQLIHDPKTGYIAQLAQARTNYATIEGDLTDANRRIQDISDAGATNLAAAEAGLKTARIETAHANERAAAILNLKVKGSDQCERLIEIDRAFVEMLK